MDKELHTLVVAVPKRIDNGLNEVQLAIVGHFLI